LPHSKADSISSYVTKIIKDWFLHDKSGRDISSSIYFKSVF
jgi:hypothetical protein